MSHIFRNSTLFVAMLLIAGCSLKPPPGFPVADDIDLRRYMGTWYVIAHIPPEKTENAYNAIERYRLEGSDTVHTVYTYRAGSFDSELQTLRPTATVVPETDDAVWGMQFVWPIELQYVISYVSPDYQRTIVARADRDYVWIMARTPTIPESKYKALVERVAEIGYDVDKLRRVPQQPLDKRSDRNAPKTN